MLYFVPLLLVMLFFLKKEALETSGEITACQPPSLLAAHSRAPDERLPPRLTQCRGVFEPYKAAIN